MGIQSGRSNAMEAFFVSTGLVALAEMGDKTQLLSLVLAARFRRPYPIIAAILIATLANHALAGLLGASINAWIGESFMRWILGISFLAMAAWTLIPDRLDEEEAAPTRFGVFGTTLIAFFIAEMGDKTQVATVALAAQYTSLIAVVAGTTVGMLIANAPVVLFGDRITRAVPMKTVHRVAAALFALLGVLALLGMG